MKENRKPNIKCSVCGTPTYRRPHEIEKGTKSGLGLFCSKECARTPYTKEPIKCQDVNCTNTFSRKLRKKYCSNECANKNRIKRGKYNPSSTYKGSNKAAKLKSLLLAIRPHKCNRCEYSKVIFLHVHHIIERCNGGSDELDNLELLCPNCHTEHHYYNKY